MKLEKIKRDDKQLLELSDNNIIDDIIELVDDGNTNTSERDTLKNYIVDCAQMDGIVNDYYILETERHLSNMEIYNLIYSYNELIPLRSALSGSNYDQKLDIIGRFIKGYRDTQTLAQKVLSIARLFLNDDEYSALAEKIIDKNNKYIVSVSNAGLSQLTSSYSKNYSSCYNLEHGEYRASNVFLMDDKKNYIVKIYNYNEDNLLRVADDTLKASNSVISRFNVFKDGDKLLACKIYGDTSFINNTRAEHVEIISQLFNISADDLVISSDDKNIDYCADFEGYEDYRYNLVIKSVSALECECIEVGSSDLITWSIPNEHGIIRFGVHCWNCGDSIDEDEACYCQDIDDYCCGECCWWCDCDGCYYSNDTRYIRTPSGDYYRYDDCEIS